jgi:KaiC/GvpD/RAD55 family RecA-like ATPase
VYGSSGAHTHKRRLKFLSADVLDGLWQEKSVSDSVIIPLLKELIPDGIEYGTNVLVEFEPDSIWYETSLTLAAHALRNGIRTDYHTFQRNPTEVRGAIASFGLDVQKLEDQGSFRIIDSYTVQTGLSEPEKPKAGPIPFQTQSVKVADWSIAIAQEYKKGVPEFEKRRFHIDDNTSILLQYNAEKTLIDYWRTRALPQARARGRAFVHSAVVRVYSEAFYKQFESLMDGIVEFKREEAGGTTQQLVRVKAFRGRKYDQLWHRLNVKDGFEVVLEI